MAQLGTRFDATTHNTEQRDYENVPDGIYRLEVDSANTAPTKAGDGLILKASVTVLEPEAYKNKKFFMNINLENQNAQAQEIGQRDLACLCRAVGLSGIEDSDELLLISFTAKVGLGKPSKDGQYPARNEIKRYYYPDEEIPAPVITGNVTPVAANTNRAAPVAANTNSAPAAVKKNPWSKAA